MPISPDSYDQLGDRVRGLLLGLVAGIEARFGPGGASRVEQELLAGTVRGLTAREVDFERMVADWVAGDARSADPGTARALDWLARNRRPPGPDELPPSSAVLARVLPVAALAAGSPPNLLSGSYHLAALWSGDPATHWSAVAANVAAAQFLLGRTDFVPDVLEALAVNDAPEPVIGAVRRVPLAPWSELDSVDVAEPVGCLQAALFVAHREPHLPRAMDWVRTRSAPWLEPLALALLGARHGEAAIAARLPLTAATLEAVDRLVVPFVTARERT